MAAVNVVGVVGAGTMGHGIAQVAASSGFKVVLYDVTVEQARQWLSKIEAELARGVDKQKITAQAKLETLARLSVTGSLSELAVADLVIEAIPEDLTLKKTLFQQLSEHCPEQTVLASNTSSLSLTDLARAATFPERVVGMHFFNPVPRMPLLELVRAHQTSEATLATAREVGLRLGKQPIVVKDHPGFASSRLGIALGMEAIRMLEEGVASAEDIDQAMVLGYGHPMGPLALTDLVGLDVRLSIAEYLYSELGSPSFRPPQLLKQLVRAGKLGRKTGQGFYSY